MGGRDGTEPQQAEPHEHTAIEQHSMDPHASPAAVENADLRGSDEQRHGGESNTHARNREAMPPHEQVGEVRVETRPHRRPCERKGYEWGTGPQQVRRQLAPTWVGIPSVLNADAKLGVRPRRPSGARLRHATAGESDRAEVRPTREKERQREVMQCQKSSHAWTQYEGESPRSLSQCQHTWHLLRREAIPNIRFHHRHNAAEHARHATRREEGAERPVEDDRATLERGTDGPAD
mmetsp:Transcript_76584/g.212747  ORF Transcript_76584/g.212747 Transcript_76584/m.212747 type:complete len:235 (+) Transcript_76584:598-1302(+)